MASTHKRIPLDETLGCVFIGTILSTALWGVGCLQLYYYFERCPKTEKLWLKIYTTLVWVIDTVHQVLLVTALYMYCVKEFGNLFYLTRPQRILLNEAVLTAIIDAMVQSLLLMRAWILSNGNLPLMGALVIAVAAHFAIVLAYFGQVYNFTQFTQLLTVIDTERAMNAIVAAMELFIAAILVYLLWRHRPRVKKTDTIIQRLVMYTISTGLVTGLWAIVALVGAIVRPDSLIYLLVDLVIPKLYVNCMLASLNARSSLRENLARNDGLVSIHLDDLPPSSNERPSKSKTVSRKASTLRTIECRVDINKDISSETQDKRERLAFDSDIDIARSASSLV